MATVHPRVGVVKDPELSAALEASRDLLDAKQTRSEAGHVRQLAIIGARALASGHTAALGARDRQRVLDTPGVRAATRRPDDLPWLGEPVDHARRATAALDWARGER